MYAQLQDTMCPLACRQLQTSIGHPQSGRSLQACAVRRRALATSRTVSLSGGLVLRICDQTEPRLPGTFVAADRLCGVVHSRVCFPQWMLRTEGLSRPSHFLLRVGHHGPATSMNLLSLSTPTGVNTQSGVQCLQNNRDWKPLSPRELPGNSGVPISANVSGAQFGKTIVRAATPGTISVTIRRGPEPIAGEKTVWPVFPMTVRTCAFRSRCGTEKIRS